MNVQHKLTTAHLMPTARMRTEHSSVHVRRDLQEMGNRAMVGSTVQCPAVTTNYNWLPRKRCFDNVWRYSLLTASSLQTLMNVLNRLTIVRQMPTARTQMERSSARVKQDLQEMGKRAMVGFTVHWNLTRVLLRRCGKIYRCFFKMFLANSIFN